MNRVLSTLSRRSSWSVLALALGLVLVFGSVGYLAPDYSLSILYLIPIALTTGPLGLRAGVLVSFASALAMLAAETQTVFARYDPVFPWWYTAIHLVFFVVFAFLLFLLRQELQAEEFLAREDPTTGAANRRAFFDLVGTELERSRRYGKQFSLALLDLDNFKSINDEFGHEAGDELLRAVVQLLRAQLRTVDTVARLGGDEFGILLPETPADGAEAVLEKVRVEFDEMMVARKWRVTFSCGAVAFGSAPPNVSHAIRTADDLMYVAKRAGKDQVKVQTWGSEQIPEERSLKTD
jgi:diguanylate cyclase (GGDEF)-like protein